MMNTSKINLHFLFLNLFLFSIVACATNEFEWTEDGYVTTNKKTVKLDLQNAYYAFEYKKDVFVLGFKIDSGINQPTVVKVTREDAKQRYWSFKTVLKQVFEYKKRPHLLDMNGYIYRLDNDTWKKTSIKLKPKSMVLDTRYGILACNPSSPFKSSGTFGGCYMADGKWEIKANWRETEPEICKNNLVLINTIKNLKYLNTYSISDGKLLSTRIIAKTPEDLCLAVP